MKYRTGAASLADQIYAVGAHPTLCRFVDRVENEARVHGLAPDAVDLQVDVAGPGTITVVIALTFPLATSRLTYSDPYRSNAQQMKQLQQAYLQMPPGSSYHASSGISLDEFQELRAPDPVETLLGDDDSDDDDDVTLVTLTDI